MSKYIVKFIKISLGVVLASIVMVGFVAYVSGYFSYTSIINVAKTLPSYEDVNLASGERGEKSCYFHYDSSICKALSISVKAEQSGDAEAKKFIMASQNMGIKWSEYNDKLTRVDSHVFVRDGRNYEVSIEHEKDGTVSISLLEY